MNPGDIHGKKLIAVAGEDVFGKSFINVVNKEIASFGLMAIGININTDDFGFFISNLADSKVEVTIFMPVFQKEAAKYFGKDGYVVAAIKGEDGLLLLEKEKQMQVEDVKLLDIVKELRMDYGV